MVEQRLLVVRDVWSGRYSLPQTQRRAHETLAQSATRAVYEQTGLRLAAIGQVLWTDAGMRPFACEVYGDTVLAQATAVPLSYEGRRAMLEARLFDATQLAQAEFRNSCEARFVVAHLHALEDASLPHARCQQGRTVLGRLLRAQLRGAHWLQRHLNLLPQNAAYGPQYLGRVTLWVMGFGAIVWTMGRWRQGAELVLFALVAALIGAALKDLCALPRPFHLDPNLPASQTSGYSFPSGVTLMLTAAVGLALRQTRRHAWAWLAAMVCFGCGFICVIQGRNFMHDVVGAWILGAALVLGYETILRRANLAYMPLRAWLVVGLGVGAVAVGLQPLPWPTEALGLLVGVCMGLPWCRRAYPSLSLAARTALCAAMLFGLWLMAWWGQYAISAASSALGAVCARMLTAMAMGLVLPLWHHAAHVGVRRT
jgi:membrane-associated phospholipid phosphatase/ADP-ribose pyrophosphatase YjhB (NUDIX family)